MAECEWEKRGVHAFQNSKGRHYLGYRRLYWNNVQIDVTRLRAGQTRNYGTNNRFLYYDFNANYFFYRVSFPGIKRSEFR